MMPFPCSECEYGSGRCSPFLRFFFLTCRQGRKRPAARPSVKKEVEAIQEEWDKLKDKNEGNRS